MSTTNREDALHAAVCRAVGLLNMSPAVISIAEGREAWNTLRQALVNYADAVMEEPTSEGEQIAMRRLHAGKGRR